MIEVHLPDSKQHHHAMAWVLDVVFRQWLDVPYQVKSTEEKSYHIVWQGKTLVMPNILFAQEQANLPSPQAPLRHWAVADFWMPLRLSKPTLPVLYGTPLIGRDQNTIRCEIDVFGTVFWMLSRYEEVTSTVQTDEHDRFPARASLAHREGFLLRPLVDEYVAVLHACLSSLGLPLGAITQGQIVVTCDVDRPHEYYTPYPINLARNLVRGFSNGREWVQKARNVLASFQQDYRHDRFYTFDWYMDACEKHNRRARFYFLAGRTTPKDADYYLTQPSIQHVLKEVHRRRHEIGLHGSYNTYRNPQQMQQEFGKLAQALRQLGIEQPIEGNRQHYLRWDSQQTPEHLQETGYLYDTTGSFADMAGFRYGTARPFTMWGWQARRALTLIQRPLILMECSVIAKNYMGLGYSEQALSTMHHLKEESLRFGGDFTLLWHNSFFLHPQDKLFFQALIQ